MNNKILSNAFNWLCIGLLICFITSYVTTLNETIFHLVYLSFNGLSYLIYLIAELILAVVLVIRIRKMSNTTAKILYIAYTLLTGLSLGGIFLIYTGSSIAFIFLVTSILFGIFAIIGKKTKIDLSKWSTYLLIALISIVILEIINLILLNNTLNMIVCSVGIIIFCIYIAYDIQLALNVDFLSDTENKGIYIAFQLFVDFVNLFMDLLSLFGKEKN
ncbi:MAG TPA: hypothetical protein DCE23_07980 [Firmicutes bacterium]|nr:hypothetical protein [Bacillota bacterium]